MLRVLALLTTTGACWSTPPSSPPTLQPTVDVDRVRAAVQGSWSTSLHGDTVTQTRTFAFGAGEVVRSETHVQIGGTPTTSPRGSVPYRISEHGAVAFAPATDESLEFTAIVAAGDVCAALHDHPCRVLGWDGMIAQSPTVYRREYARTSPGRRSSFITIVRFARPPAELVAAPGACKLTLEIVATGDEGRIDRRFDFGCTATPAARGRLARIAVAGFETQRDGLTTAWSNYPAVSRLSGSQDRVAYDAFRMAFQPVMYFDPADPWVLYYDRPSGYHADP